MSIQIYTDGSALGNPGPGGWAARIHHEGKITELSGGEGHTTNNRMELLAVIEALRHIEAKKLTQEPIEVYSDSSWVIKTMTDNWKRKKNLDLWMHMDALVPGKKISWNWVKGHANNAENNACDEAARAQALRHSRNATKPTSHPTLL